MLKLSLEVALFAAGGMPGLLAGAVVVRGSDELSGPAPVTFAGRDSRFGDRRAGQFFDSPRDASRSLKDGAVSY
jgi:hypothetical protein